MDWQSATRKIRQKVATGKGDCRNSVGKDLGWITLALQVSPRGSRAPSWCNPVFGRGWTCDALRSASYASGDGLLEPALQVRPLLVVCR